MGIVANLLSPRAANQPGPADDFWYTSIGAGTSTASGVTVSPDTAAKFSAVWACGRLLSETIAALPLLVYRNLADGGRDRAPQHPLYDVLRSQPNAWQTALEFVELMTWHCLFRGNAYAQKVPGPRGAVDQLVPIHPDRVRIEPLVGLAYRYRVRQQDGTEQIVNSEDLFHLRGLSLDGRSGVSVIEYARESIGLAIAAESYGARVFSQDATPRGILQHPGKLGRDAAERLSREWALRNAGLANAHRTAVLEEGMTFARTAMTNEDAQFLGTREYSVEDVARWFRVPLHMISSTTKATSWGSGIESLSLGFVIYTLLPWLRRWEQAISRDLIVNTESFFAEFLVAGLLRGDLASRYQSYATARQWGWLSVNDIRRLENMNPLGSEGDEYLRPLNMAPAGTPPPAAQLGAEHYHILVQDGAARVVRKENAALSRAASRPGNDWAQAVAELCAGHVDYVAQVLRVPREIADDYVQELRAALLAEGVVAVQDPQGLRVARLVQLATGGDA